ncbi:hypothetical protein IWW51_000340 [Coemansia sp. RSA 2702]|nr:hypothetical protein IWW52_003280 [Coemansia sp. RSA 2704]KAJ2329846.1 hypothetical protein IWW51_000340 [Coemansia sp. RSA 2702]
MMTKFTATLLFGVLLSGCLTAATDSATGAHKDSAFAASMAPQFVAPGMVPGALSQIMPPLPMKGKALHDMPRVSKDAEAAPDMMDRPAPGDVSAESNTHALRRRWYPYSYPYSYSYGYPYYGGGYPYYGGGLDLSLGLGLHL